MVKSSGKYTLFSWINEICVEKRDWEDIPTEQKEVWSTFMVNKILSHDINLLPIVNEVQELEVEPKYIYNIYREVIPKGKRYIKLTKNSKRKIPEYIKLIANKLEISTAEVTSYLDLLTSKDIIQYFRYLGISDKEIKKML